MIRTRSLFFKRIAPLVFVLIIAAGLVWSAAKVAAFLSRGGGVYSAVFLDNGQVYFGEVKHIKRTYVTVTDVYYFGRDGGTNFDNPDLSLVKLGSEVHSPTDELTINRQHILFIETLTADSKVVEAIVSYKNNESR